MQSTKQHLSNKDEYLYHNIFDHKNGTKQSDKQIILTKFMLRKRHNKILNKLSSTPKGLKEVVCFCYLCDWYSLSYLVIKVYTVDGICHGQHEG